MAKPYTIKNSHVAVLITVLIAIFLGACYFFIYVPNHEKTVQERYFRCLQNVDENINAKIQNSAAQLTALLDVDTDDANFKKYINNPGGDYYTFIDNDKFLQKQDSDGTFTEIDQTRQRVSIYVVKTVNGKIRKLGMCSRSSISISSPRSRRSLRWDS